MVYRCIVYVSPPGSVPPRDLRNFLLTLGDQWEVVARFLGYSSEEVAAIASRFPSSVGKQVRQRETYSHNTTVQYVLRLYNV